MSIIDASLNILITGHNGYLGSVLCSELLNSGHKLSGLDLSSSGNSPKELSELKIQDFRKISIKHLSQFDVIIHLAGFSKDIPGAISSDEMMEINGFQAINFALKAKNAGVKKFIFASSCLIYGSGNDHLLDEEFLPNPLSPYAKAKLIAEENILKMANSGFSPIVLRCGTLYGYSPQMRLDLVLNNFVASAFSNKTVLLKSNGMAWRSLIHVRDAAAVYRMIAESTHNKFGIGVFNLGHEKGNVQILDLAHKVVELIPGSILKFANANKSDARSFRLNCGKLNKVLEGLKFQWDIEKGVKEMLDALLTQS